MVILLFLVMNIAIWRRKQIIRLRMLNLISLQFAWRQQSQFSCFPPFTCPMYKCYLYLHHTNSIQSNQFVPMQSNPIHVYMDVIFYFVHNQSKAFNPYFLLSTHFASNTRILKNFWEIFCFFYFNYTEKRSWKQTLVC